MRVEGKVTSPALVVWAVAVALILLFSSALVQAQGDGPQEDLTLEELQEQREVLAQEAAEVAASIDLSEACLLYTSPSPRDRQKSRMPSSA